ncbi:MAG: diguanylate cyclase [Pseudomonadota bacterium]|nr:diguanylate cyclase [Pseudomonadota bacterium]
MSNPIRSRLALRSTAIITALLLGLGLVVIAITAPVIARQESASQHRQLEGLVNTVEHTAAIASFLGDDQLAGEILDGLSNNATVSGALIRAGEQVLASRGDLGGEETGIIRRPLMSPFNRDEQVGEVVLASNQGVIREQVKAATLLASTLLLLLVIALGLCVIAVVVRMITRPITTISNRLHGLKVELGQKLDIPNGNEQDEVGRLVRDVNAMIDYLVNLLNSEKALRREKELNERKFRAIFENAQSAIFVTDSQGVLLSSNPAFLRLFDVSPQQLGGPNPPLLFDLVGDQAGPLQARLRQCLDNNRGTTVEVTLGQPGRWLELIMNPGGEGTVQVIANDITAFKHATSKAEQKACTDALTGLGNRLGFEQRIHNLLDGDARGEPFALIYLDLDRFKEVNDSHGHQAGDAVLIKVGEILRALARKSDFIARLGGDEFVLLLEGVDREDVCTRLATEFLAVLDQPLALNDTLSVSVGASIGIAFGETGAVSAEAIIAQADEAMYRAKEQGRHRYCIHRPSAH